MATLDYSRSVNQDLATKEDRLFNAILDFTRDDSGAVDFSGKDIKMEILNSGGIVDTLTSDTEITISTARLTISKIFTDLQEQAYDYRLFNDTDKIGISHGQLIVK